MYSRFENVDENPYDLETESNRERNIKIYLVLIILTPVFTYVPLMLLIYGIDSKQMMLNE